MNRPAAERRERRQNRLGITPQPTPCIETTWGRSAGGYGAARRGGRRVKAHRYAWEQTNGPIPAGLMVLHRCDNPPCINVDHLFLGTAADNMADRDAKGRVASGDRNGARLHPESRPRGDRSAFRLYPHLRLFGDKNPRRTHPETTVRGSRHLSAKLTEADIPVIRARLASGEAQAQLAREYGVTSAAIRFVGTRRTWRHVA